MVTLFMVGMLSGSGVCALAAAWWWRLRQRRATRETWLAQQFFSVNGKLDVLVGRGSHPAGGRLA